MEHALIPDEENLRRRVENARGGNRLISEKTAREIAAWLAAGSGPGLRVFVQTGLVTGELYGELGRLYEQRRSEVEGWLDALARYSLRRMAPGRSAEPSRCLHWPEDCHERN